MANWQQQFYESVLGLFYNETYGSMVNYDGGYDDGNNNGNEDKNNDNNAASL